MAANYWVQGDPDGTLREAREAYRKYSDAEYGSEEERTALVNAVETFDNLDRHLKAGGALPADWDVAPDEPKPISWSINEIDSALTTNQRMELTEFVLEGRKIHAIKELRTFLSCGLKEAKDYIDTLGF